MQVSLRGLVRGLAALLLGALVAPDIAAAGPTPCTVVNNVATCTLDQSNGVNFTTAPAPGTHSNPTGVSHVIVNSLSKPIAPAGGVSGVQLSFDLVNATPSTAATNGFSGPALAIDVAAGQPINVIGLPVAFGFPTNAAIFAFGRGGNGTDSTGGNNGGAGADGSAITINNNTALNFASTVVPSNRATAFGLGGQLAQAQAGETRIESALTCLALPDINTCTTQQKLDVAYFSCVFTGGAPAFFGNSICLGGAGTITHDSLVGQIKSAQTVIQDQISYLTGVPAPGEQGTLVGGAIFAESIGGNGGSNGSANLLSTDAGGNGGNGGAITINNSGAITVSSASGTNGAYTAGISAISQGGNGGFPGIGWILVSDNLGHPLSDGVHAGDGGTITVVNSGAISASVVSSPGIFAQSSGGRAGVAVPGIIGGKGGAISITDTGAITTTKDNSAGIFAQSVGGPGAAGGKAGKGGDVSVDIEGTINTQGLGAHGVYVASVGGRGGDGAGSGNGGDGGDAGLANVLAGPTAVITTKGKDAVGLYAASLPGLGGTGGSDSGIFYADAGGGGNGGQGGNAVVVNKGIVTTSGAAAYGIFAQALGGTGGVGGGAAALVSSSGSGGGGAPAGNASATNNGKITTSGVDAYGIYVQSVAGSGGDAGSAGGFVALGSDGGSGAAAQCLANPALCLNGGDVTALNTGTITTSGTGADGIFIETIGGGGGNGGSASGVFTFGGGGGAGGNGGLLSATNGGAIITTGDLTTGIFAQSVGGGGGNGGNASSVSTSVSVSIGGSGGSGGMGGVVNVTNNGTISDSGQGVTGIFAQSIGGGGGNGGDASSLGTLASVAIGGSGGGGGKGGKVTVVNGASGSISVNGYSSTGIFAQSVGGGGGDGGDATSTDIGVGFAGSVSIGGHGADGGGAGDLVSVTNNGAIFTSGDFSDALFVQSVGGGGGNGGAAYSTAAAVGGNIPAVSASVSVGGSGGNGGNGGAVTVINTGTITTLDWNSIGIFAQSVGGGGGDGGSSSAKALSGSASFTVSIAVAVGGHGGGGGIGAAVNVTNNGSVSTFGDMSDAVFAQSVGGGGGNGGDASTTTYSLTGKKGANVDVAVGGNGGNGNNGGIVNVINNGTIVALGNMSRGIVAQSVGGGGGNGGAGTQEPLFDFIDLPSDFDKDPSNKSLKDQVKDKFNSLKKAVADFKAHPGTFGKDLVKNHLKDQLKPDSIGVSVGVGGTGGAGGDGQAVSVINTQSVVTGGFMGFGIFAQSVGGGGGDGGGGDASGSGDINVGFGVGGSSGGAGKGGTATVTNTGDITTFGNMAYGIFAQSVGGGGGVGGAGGGATDHTPSLSLSIGGTAGSSGNGDLVTVLQNGNVVTVGDNAIGVLAQSVGGGGGVGGAAEAGNYLNVSVGGNGSAGGNGGDVSVAVNGSIATLGALAHGVFAQSVGGGGGLAGSVTAQTLEIGVAPLGTYKVDTGVPFAVGVVGLAGAAGSGGNGGKITINTSGTISTSGTGADGIFAQSIGGGGGSGGSSNLPIGGALNINGSNGGAGTAGKIDIVHTGSIFATGAGANGIVAQSMGGSSVVTVTPQNCGIVVICPPIVTVTATNAAGLGDNITITLKGGGTVSGGTGGAAGILISGGKDNTINNQGGTITALSGLAILGGAGNDAVENNGVVHGTVGLGGGTNSFHNAVNGTFETGQFIFINPNSTIVNDGTLSPFGTGFVGTTAMTGNLVQSTSGVFIVDVNFKVGPSDLVAMDGTATLGGKALLGPHHTTDLVPNKFVTVLTAGGIVDKGISIDDTLVVDYGVRIQGNTFQVGVNSVQFVPKGVVLTPNEISIGNHLEAAWASGNSGGLTPLMDYLGGLTTPATYATTIGSLDPGNAQPETSTLLFAGMAFTGGLMSCPGTSDPTDALHEHDCFWGRVGGFSGKQTTTPTAVGYRSGGLRIQGGRQVEVAPNWFVGAAFGYEADHADVPALAFTSGKLYNAGLVGKYEDGSWTFAGAIDLTYGDTRLTRFVIFPTNLAAASAPQQLLLDAKFRISDVLREEDFYLKPMLDADLYYVETNGFHETGAGALNIIARDSHKVFGSGGLGVEIGTVRKFDDGTLLRPYLSGGFIAFTDHRWEMMARFEGSPAGTPDFAISQTFPGFLGRATAGLEASLGEGTARFEYDSHFGSHYFDQSGSIKLEIRL